MDDRSLILVIGPGRSGTSSMAGAIASSGYHVPQAIKGNKTNPTGFFEPRWVVNLHKRLLDSTHVNTLDGDPAGLSLVEKVNQDAEVRAEVRTWLEERFAKHPRLVLKDPRMMWFTPMWVDVARELGVEPGFVIMLRHPSEVSASRATYYASRDVGAVSGWINVALLTEQLTAGSPRKFVHYPDLLEDWRPQLAGIASNLDITFDPPVGQRPHPVDELIDPALRRMSSGWDDIAVPEVLSALADRVFEVFHSESQAGEVVAPERFAELRQEYADLYGFAQAMTLTSRRRHDDSLRRRVARRVRAQLREQEATADKPASLLARIRRSATR